MDINELLGYSANCSLVICDGLASIKGNWPYSLRLLGNWNKLQQADFTFPLLGGNAVVFQQRTMF